jgi:hypothetical protein
MAKTDEDVQEVTRDDQLADPVVHRQGEPIIEVEIVDDVDAFIDGEKVHPGETAFVDPLAAVHLVTEGHARIVGSRDIDEAKKDRLKREAAYEKFRAADAKAYEDEQREADEAAKARAKARAERKGSK